LSKLLACTLQTGFPRRNIVSRLQFTQSAPVATFLTFASRNLRFSKECLEVL